MSSDEMGVYADAKYRDTDIGAIMRQGHPDIEAGDQYIVKAVERLRRERNRPLRVLDVGAGSGHLSWLLAQTLSDGEVIANEVSPNSIAQARAKLSPFRHSRIFDRSFDDWNEPVDAIISWGSHHHLSHNYRPRRRLLGPDGVLMVGDEMCGIPHRPISSGCARATIEMSMAASSIAGRPSGLRGAASRPNGTRGSNERASALGMVVRRRFRSRARGVDGVDHRAPDRPRRSDYRFAEEHKTSPFLLQRELELNRFTILESTPSAATTGRRRLGFRHLRAGRRMAARHERGRYGLGRPA